jgi:hypothetical protein
MTRNLDGRRSDVSNLRSRNKNELIDNFDIGWKGMLRRVIIRIN